MFDLHGTDALFGTPIVASEHMTRRVTEFDSWGRFWTWGDSPETKRWATFFGFAREVDQPCAAVVGGTLVAHPAIIAQLRQEYGR